MKLKIKGDLFIDKEGRSVMLRGVNLGGSTKVPVKPNGATHIKTDFSDHRFVSFIGHPFPIEEADEHLSRLKNWGFNCIRLLTTWEAIEHEGPGKYDRAYLKYLREVLEKIGEYDFYCFIDPHQDVWSRMSGGDGAPGWTFEKVGLDFTKFDETDAALLMQHRYPDEYPLMCWSTNYNRFAAATMFTLFFGGNDFAPGFTIENKSIQDYLQEHYINSMKEVVKICKDLPHVLGYDIFNEPNKGFIETANLAIKPPFSFGAQISSFEGMVTASGFARELDVIEIKGFRERKTGTRIINPNEVSCWLPNAKDIWREVGIWDINNNGQPRLLKPDYFLKVNGKKVNFFWDYLRPFINRYAETLRSVHPEAMIFVETDPFETFVHNESTNPTQASWSKADCQNIVNASHWYDTITLYLRKFFKLLTVDTQNRKIVLFPRNVKKFFIQQLRKVKDFSKNLGNCPTIIGEVGIPFNLNNKKAYRTGDWSSHIDALTLHINCLDANLLNYTQWNYTADNCNEWGDLWNLEDFSIFSRDQQTNPSDINSGGRAIKGFCRPFARKTAGRIISMSFNRKKGKFVLEFKNESLIDAPTEIYVPKIQFPKGYQVILSDRRFEKREEDQLLLVYNEKIGFHRIEIRREN